MKSSSLALKNSLKNNYSLKSSLRVIAEWNHNRYADILSVKNGSSVDAYPEIFPINSICGPRRPQRSGIVKLFTGEDILNVGNEKVPARARTYLASESDPYKYWLSPNQSQNIGLPGFIYPFETPVQPEVVYATNVQCNKIVITLENTFVNVDTSRVQITTNGINWTTVYTNPDVNLDGQVIIYRQVNGTWNPTPDYTSPIPIRGVRYIIDGIDEPNTHVGVIEVSARLENDLSPFVIDFSVSNEVSSQSFIAPMGVASSNRGSLLLSSVDGRFNHNNGSSPYRNMLDRGVKFTVDMGIDTLSAEGGGMEYVRLATMYSNEIWSGQTTEEVQVEISDSASFMQNEMVPQLFFENETIGSIIWHLCDIMGFPNFAYIEHDLDKSNRVPYFWTNGEETLWEIISELAEGTQTAIYFNEFDILQIKTRNATFDKTKTIDWNFDGVRNGIKLPDIIEYNQVEDYEANSVTVSYQNTKVSSFNNGSPQMEPVWEPEDLVLRGSPITASMTINSGNLFIPKSDAVTWPYSGFVNIDGEIISYDGKEYFYYDKSNVLRKIVVKNKEEQDNINSNLASESLYFKTEPTGGFVVTGRGLRGSTSEPHLTTIKPNYIKRVLNDRQMAPEPYLPGEGTVKDSKLNVTTHKAWDHSRNFVLGWATNFSAPKSFFGTRLRINSGIGPKNNGEAGVFFGANSNFRGYYVSLYPTEAADAYERKSIVELVVWVKKWDGTQIQLARTNVEILRDVWYDLDVTYSRDNNSSSSSDHLTVFINGTVQADVNVHGNNRAYTFNGIHGIQTGTWCGVDFEYFYALEKDIELVHRTDFLDLVKGRFSSGIIDRNFKLEALYRRQLELLRRFSRTNGPIFDDFGSWVHEVRDFEVKFDKAPVTHSRLYMSNDYQAACTDYLGEPFGAKFTVANTYRGNAILKGEDKVTFGADNPVEQKIFVYGRLVTQEEEKEYTVKNLNAIRRRGEVKVDFASKWIQTEATAKAIGDWVVANWSGGVDEVSLIVFGNPLVQLGDLVTLNIPVKSIDPSTHKYFVIGIENSYKEGLETNLTLRRAKIT